MNEAQVYFLPSLSVIDLIGNDASAVANNLTTNEIVSLDLNQGRETFVTDVRGKTVAHVHLFRQTNGLRMVGAAGQSERVAAHIDRYIIREDAAVEIKDSELTGLLLSSSLLRHAAEQGWIEKRTLAVTESDLMTASEPPSVHPDPLVQATCKFGDAEVASLDVRWLSDDSRLVLAENIVADSLKRWFASQGIAICDEAEFHHQRTLAAFPWYGVDIDESNLPQEISRDHETISFTKGCYLGQETVARLDAMGQVQRKLVRWAISDAVPDAGSTLSCNDKTVGRLTSVAKVGENESIAIGFARRTHFDPPATATGTIPSSGESFTATVIPG